MKTQAELGQDIIKITMKMHLEYPELSKYMDELPEKMSGNNYSQIDSKNLKEYCNLLNGTLMEYAKTHISEVKELESFPGYPAYPGSDDIFVKGKEEMDLDPEDPTKKKTWNEAANTANEKEFEDDLTGEDLDVPGSELDDQEEMIGSEDEENNYYSIGGDNHDNLDENTDKS